VSESIDHPTLSAPGQAMLRFLREHPAAPKFSGRTGSRLSAEDLTMVSASAVTIEQARLLQPEVKGKEPAWLRPFLNHTVGDVPFHRRRGATLNASESFDTFPTTSRADLSADITSFVPDSVEIDRMIAYETSGTTGHPLQVPSHPRVAALYLPHHRRALARFGVTMRAGEGTVGCVLLGMQQRCFTYVSVMPQQHEAGLVKCNLHPDDWTTPSDRSAYLEALQPELVSGDPISFVELLAINPSIRPRALLSTSMALSPSLRRRLELTFGCPVLDLYSMNEAGPIAVFDDRAGGHVLLQSRLFVEIVDDTGHTVPYGVRGEITLTGGFNHCLPLVRYRTGDFASMVVSSRGELMLYELIGRLPVRFRHGDGTWVNNVDVLHAMKRFPASQFAVHQCADESIRLTVQAPASVMVAAEDAMRGLLKQRVEVKTLSADAAKIRQFTTDLACGMVSA
jgi:phenylacetate-CoA ligase